MSNLCPTCGQPIKRPGVARRLLSAYGSYRQTRIASYQSTSLTPWQPQPPPGSSEPGRYLEAERRSPYRPQNAESDFLVPALQALATGVFVTIGAGWVAWKYPGFTADMALGCGVLAAGGFWVLTVLANRKLLWMVETITNGDLDNDGVIGEPPPPRPVALEVTHRNEAGTFGQMFRFDLPSGVTEDDFKEFARGVTTGRGLAESGWIGSGKPFSRQSYNALLAALEQAGIVRWKDDGNHAAGRELTPSGARSLRSWLKMDTRSLTLTQRGNDYEFIPGIG